MYVTLRTIDKQGYGLLRRTWRRGPRTPSRTTITNLNLLFVKKHIFFIMPKIGRDLGPWPSLFYPLHEEGDSSSGSIDCASFQRLESGHRRLKHSEV